ncbi:hypothetical protein DFH07DRAFT_768706 [Mycena maculata]|uniref:Uncharacterized protein n=1 Tax=Mycena maculata TaxID=230809 RepID=A0AAD7JR54_9AGAR|nr:hypothetical protein DFH07DRAFT_768706 [Mycena maculata]
MASKHKKNGVEVEVIQLKTKVGTFHFSTKGWDVPSSEEKGWDIPLEDKIVEGCPTSEANGWDVPPQKQNRVGCPTPEAKRVGHPTSEAKWGGTSPLSNKMGWDIPPQKQHRQNGVGCPTSAQKEVGHPTYLELANNDTVCKCTAMIRPNNYVDQQEPSEGQGRAHRYEDQQEHGRALQKVF